MKKIILLIAVFALNTSYGQYTAIPDANFEQALFDLGIDTVNGDHQVLTSAVSGVTQLYVYSKNIADLTGIQAFTNLQVLNCNYNQLISLDVSANTALTTLECQNNSLSSLDVRGINNLQFLNTQSNPLLSCVSVNDVVFANSNYFKDATTVFSTNCNASLYTAIPDANFEQALFDLGIDNVNGDHQVLTAAVSGVTYLFVNSKNIADLTGLQAFTNLQLLNCSYNSLSSLDVSANTALINLYCNENSLISLDISDNLALIELNCESNSLSSIDLSANAALTILYCSYNSLSSLDVSANTALTTLVCDYNSLSSLNVSANTALTTLSCSNNSLSSLNLSANTALNYLYCEDNSLSSLDVSENTALQYLSCSNNSLSSLDVSANTALQYLSCSINSLSSLDVSANTALTSLSCSDNSLSSLNLSANTALNYLYCEDNSLSSLDVRGLINLQILSTLSNPLLSCISVNDVAYATSNYTKDAATVFSTNCSAGLYTAIPDANFEQALFDLGIDTVNGDHQVLTAAVSGVTNLNVGSKSILDLTGIQAFTNLQVLQCSYNYFSSLDLSYNTALTQLFCYNNLLSSLNVSANTALIQLNCSFNYLSSLDVSANTALEVLNCSNNYSLSSLDVSENRALYFLNSTNNYLINSLDVSENTALNYLYCSGNSLSSLNVSANTALIDLSCYNNLLSSLDVSANAALSQLSCGGNSLSSLDVSANTALNYLDCSYNSLSGLDVRGLNNLQYLYTINNPSLSCISVNNVAYATNNSNYQKDAATIFSTNCSVVSTGSTAAVLSGATTICSGNSATINVAITGGASPYTVVYSNGVSNTTVTGYVSGTAISVSPTTNTTYTLVSVTDAASNLGTGNSGSAVVTVVSPTNDGSVTTSICAGDSYTWPANGQSYSTAQTNLTHVVGCNTATLNLTITPLTTTGSVTTSICAGDSYTWPANGQSYTTAQTNLTHIVGCNTATLNLTLTPLTTTGSVTTSICEGGSYTWPANGQTYTTAQNGTTFVSGCNTATLNLTITPATTNGSVNTSICAGDSYNWPANGQSYATAQTNLTHVVGCNTATLNLTILTNLTPTVGVTSSDLDNSFAYGTPVTFTATAGNLGGGIASYNFKVNGISVQSGASATYVVNNLVDNDQVSVDITVTGGLCLSTTTASSNIITNDVIVTLYYTSITNYCGQTLPVIGTRIKCSVPSGVVGTLAYRFKVKNNVTNAITIVNSTVASFDMTMVVGFSHGTSYSIQVAAVVNGVEQPYSAVCLITTPLVQVIQPTTPCGQTLVALDTRIYASAVSGAQLYRWRVALSTAPTTYFIHTTTASSVRLTNVPGLNVTFDKTYLVAVQSDVLINGVISTSAYSSLPCSISTPSVSSVSVSANQCGQTLASLTAGIFVNSVANAVSYTYRVRKVGTTTDYDYTSFNTSFKLSDVVGLSVTNASQYNVSVSVKILRAGVYYDSPFSTPCIITTPNAPLSREIAQPFGAVAYPNPFANTFLISVTTTAKENINITVYDMVGRVLEQQEVSAKTMDSYPLGERYPSGVYNVVVTQGEDVKTLRVVKR